LDIEVFVTLACQLISAYFLCGFGRAENRFRRKPGEESPNTKERDAA